jgi:phosphoadenosine phosphosulfate reductase
MAQIDPIAAPPRPDGLRALGIVALNGMFDEKDAAGVLKQGFELLGGDLAIVSSFGADSVVLLHLVAEIAPNAPVLFLETGRHFAQTLEFVEQAKRELGLTNVRALQPDPGDLARFDPRNDLWKSDPDSCCHIRKTEPLNKALAFAGGWVTGRRRYQTSQRGVLPHFELTADDRIKINPLAYWTFDDIVAYKRTHDLPEHALIAKGYRSIGCSPCTSVVAAGEDPRAGRWRGLNKAECGIHFDFNSKIAAHQRDGDEADLRLFKAGRFVADPWRDWVEGDDRRRVRFTHVPLAEWLAGRDDFMANPHPLGLILGPDDPLEAVGCDLGRFSSVAIKFPAFTDGRGYSLARLVRERYGYESELRAVGDILVDQIVFLRRCGFDALVIKDEATRKVLIEDRVAGFSVFMQPAAGLREVPAGTRPFLRRAANPDGRAANQDKSQGT